MLLLMPLHFLGLDFWKNVLGHSENPQSCLLLPTLQLSVRGTPFSPPHPQGLVPSLPLSQAFLPMMERNEPVLATALYFSHRIAELKREMALSGRESVDLQQCHADAWQGAQSHKTSPAIAGKWHSYGRARLSNIKSAILSSLSACLSCKINKGSLSTRNSQHPSQGPGRQHVSISLFLDHAGYCIITS